MSEPIHFQLQETKCILCDSTKVERLYPCRVTPADFSPFSFSARRFRPVVHYEIGRCAKCTLVRSLAVIPEEQAEKFYRESVCLYTDLTVHVTKTYIDLLTSCQSFVSLPKNARILEIGCGNGFVLSALREQGYRNVLGFEPSSQVAEDAPIELKGCIINHPFSVDGLEPESFDCIMSFHVLDHLYRPDKFFNECAYLLRKGGCLVTVCHDVSALSAKVLGENSPIFDIEHIYLFDRTTLTALYNKIGFHVRDNRSVKNRYPIGYWMNLLPFTRFATKYLPRSILELPLALRAGNLFMCGVKS